MSKSDIKIVREHNEWRRGAETEMTCPRVLGIALEEVMKAAERYELIRTLKPSEFQELWEGNIYGGGRFDDLVDESMKARSK